MYHMITLALNYLLYGITVFHIYTILGSMYINHYHKASLTLL